jgi:CubicO group peptidase (beta-lactamase class C family)
MKTYFLFTMLFLKSLFVLGQEPVSINTEKLDSLFNALSKNNKGMGAISVFQNGVPLYSNLFGFRDSTINGILNPDKETKYRIGSITKIFTAAIIFQLIEGNKLAYQTKLSDFFPQIPNSDSITIEQMLNHHSGLPRYDHAAELDNLKAAETEDAVVNIVSNKKGHPEDRIAGHYSNLNYILLGFIIEKITKSTYDGQLKSRITDKIDLKNTYNLSGAINASKNEAHSFNYSASKWTEDGEQKWNFPDAAGGIVSTTADMSKFITCLFAGKIISSVSLAKMMTIHDRFGYGLLEVPFFDKKGYGYSGKVEGFFSGITYFPNEQLAICILLNGQIYPMNEILIGVTKILYNKSYTIPGFEVIKLNEEQTIPLKGKYIARDRHILVTISEKNGNLFATMKKTGGILKSKVCLDALSPTRLVYDPRSIIIDFTKDNSLTMNLSGAKLHLEKLN